MGDPIHGQGVHTISSERTKGLTEMIFHDFSAGWDCRGGVYSNDSKALVGYLSRAEARIYLLSLLTHGVFLFYRMRLFCFSADLRTVPAPVSTYP